MKQLYVTSIILLFSFATLSQQSVREYSETQRIAIQSYISKNNECSFMGEGWFDEQTLTKARTEWGFGKKFKPYYHTGDFNKDGISDFAVILMNKKNPNNEAKGMDIVVFNGTKGKGYFFAHALKREFNTSLFIDRGENGTLYCAVMETDDTECFIPAGKGYITESCESDE